MAENPSKSATKPILNHPQPMISVVIPAYNEEKFLSAYLTSLQAQEFEHPFEVLVVDNNSTDKTAEVAQAHGARVVFESKRGVCAARQAGTVHALGEIVVSTDADTTFSKTWLHNIYKEFSTKPIVVGVTGPCTFVEAPWWGQLSFAGLFWCVKNFYRRTGKVKYISACNTAFRKSAWSGYNTNLTQGGDEIDLLKQLQTQGLIIFLDNPVYTSSRRLHKGLVYNLIVTFLAYYLFDYFIGRLRNKSVLGSYAAIREHKPTVHPAWAVMRMFALAAIALYTYSAPASHVLASRLVQSSIVQRTDNRIDLIQSKVTWHHHHR